MRVSIIIPCFNHTTYLKQCVDSALAQTHDDVEVIFINDGSTDHSLEIARTYGNRIKIINESNRGVAAARNAGLMNSSGDFILPLDADDWISPAYLEKTLALMADSKVGVVSTHMDYNGAWSNDWQSNDPTLERLLEKNCVSVCSLIRREALLQTGGWNPRLNLGCEDWDLWIDIASRGWEIKILPEVLFHYRTHKVSMWTHTAKRIDECIATIHDLHSDLYAKQPDIVVS